MSILSSAYYLSFSVVAMNLNREWAFPLPAQETNLYIERARMFTLQHLSSPLVNKQA